MSGVIIIESMVSRVRDRVRDRFKQYSVAAEYQICWHPKLYKSSILDESRQRLLNRIAIAKTTVLARTTRLLNPSIYNKKS
jgi:hypothetical protein